MSQIISYGTKNTMSGLVLQCIIRSAVAGVIAFLIYASVTIIAVGGETKEIGYKILYSEDGQSYEEVYSHYYSDGDDLKFKEYDGKEKYYKTPIRSELSENSTNIVRWISQVVSLVIWFSMIYGIFWKAGDSNADFAELGNAKLDKFKGIKAGLLADIPVFLAYAVLVISYVFKVLPSYPKIYKILTYFMFGFNDIFIKGTINGFVITPLSIILSAIVLLPIPLMSSYAYFMGQKHIIIKEKIIYKKEEN